MRHPPMACEQNAKHVHAEIARTEDFCNDSCILWGAGEAPRTGVPMVLFWRKGSFSCPQGDAVMQKLENISVGQALISSSTLLVCRSKDTGEQRGDHCGNHRLHPRGGCAGVCHLLPAQERQDRVWPLWQTGHVSTAARLPSQGVLGAGGACHSSCFPSHSTRCSQRSAEGCDSGGDALCWGLGSRFQLPPAWGPHRSPRPHREAMRRTAEW